jgi:hypothetical protein
MVTVCGTNFSVLAERQCLETNLQQDGKICVPSERNMSSLDAWPKNPQSPQRRKSRLKPSPRRSPPPRKSNGVGSLPQEIFVDLASAADSRIKISAA